MISKGWGRHTFTSLCMMCVLFGTGCDNNKSPTAEYETTVPMGEPLELFRKRPIGNTFQTPPRIAFVDVVDLDQDGLQDVLVCDCISDEVSWIRQTSADEFEEIVILDEFVAPAHTECVDFDGDGDLDVIVAILGKLYPSNEKIGSLLVLENNGEMVFSPHVLLDDVARVSDARAADLDSDGKLDLVVTQFGYHDGQIQWLRNLGDWKFEGTVLQSLAGGIHGVPQDMNGDGALDIVLLVSQQFERVYLFEGDGKGNFTERLLFQATTPEFGSSGMWIEDLDQDGKPDILFANGDAFDYSPPSPWPWHGIQWMQNKGRGNFEYNRLTSFGGAVSAQACDVDFDGDLDLLCSSTFNDWNNPDAPSLILLENQGDMSFIQHNLANSPSHIQSIAVGDLNEDGKPDLVTGGMHVWEPYDRVQRIMLWNGIDWTKE